MKFYVKISIILGVVICVGYITYKMMNPNTIEPMIFYDDKMRKMYLNYNIKIDSKNQTLTKGNKTISYATNFNPISSRMFARNKTKSSLLMSQNNIPVCKQVTWNNKKSDAENVNIINRELKFPVIMKPQVGRKGINVFTDINDNSTLIKTKKILMYAKSEVHSDHIIIEEQAYGEKYRIFIVNQRIIFIKREPQPYIIGDGKQSVTELINSFNTIHKEHPIHNINENVIKKQGYKMDGVVENKKKITVSHVASAANGSDEIVMDISKLNMSTHKMLIDVSKLLKFNICGIDYITKDLSLPYDVDGKVIEVNSSPGITENMLSKKNVATRLIDALFSPMQYK